jgi:phage FluMu protein Com
MWQSRIGESRSVSVTSGTEFPPVDTYEGVPMSYVRCQNCSLIIEASPRPPSWRCPNCKSTNPSTPMPATAPLERMPAHIDVPGH